MHGIGAPEIAMLVFVVIWNITIVDIVRSGIALDQKVAWLVFVVFLSAFGIIVYFIRRKQLVLKTEQQNDNQVSKRTNPLLVLLLIVIVGISTLASTGILAAVITPQFTTSSAK